MYFKQRIPKTVMKPKNRSTWGLVIAVAVAAIALTVAVVQAQQKPQLIVPIWGSLMYVPGTPI